MAIFAALLTSSAMFTSCGDDDTNNTLPNNDPVIPVTPDEGEAMSPADQKERLETVALDFMAQTPSSDFDAIGNLADYIKDTYVDDYDWDNVGDWAEDIFDAARQALGTTTTEIETEHYGDSSYEYNSIYTNYKAVLMASNFTGHFTARNGRWELSEADDLRFIFPDQNGQECVVRLETSGDVKQVYAFNVDDWMDYDYENSGDTYISNDYYDRTQCTIGVPEHIVVTLTQNNSQVVRTAIDIDLGSIQDERFDISKNNLTLAVLVEANNGYRFNLSQVAYTANSKAAVSFEMSKNNSPLITVATTADVHDIPSCNVDAFSSENFDPDDYDTDNTNANNAFVKVDVMGKVQIQGTLSDVRKFVDYIEDADDNSSNESLYKSYLNQANGLADVNLFSDNTSTKQATVSLAPVIDESWSGSTYWTMEPVLNFYDGSSYSTFEAFFNDDDFKSVIDTFKTLSNRYADLVGEHIDW